MEAAHCPASDAGKLCWHFDSGPRKTGVRGCRRLGQERALALEVTPRPIPGTFLVPFGVRQKEPALPGGTVLCPPGGTRPSNTKRDRAAARSLSF